MIKNIGADIGHIYPDRHWQSFWWKENLDK